MFKEKEFVMTDLPVLNIAFSGRVDGGILPGLTILAGESKTFKSALSLYCMKAYLNKYSDAVGILYDTEFGITPEYIKTFGIDPDRVIHIPVEHVEQLKFDFMKKLEAVEKGDHVFFMVDSIGMLASKKEVDDAAEEKSVADMSRAKALRSLLRLITVQLSTKSIPCFMINHVYAEIGMFPKTVIPGGQAVTYSANQIFVITKAQDKAADGELDGWKFTINIFKSRYVREKAKLPFTVHYEGGIQRYSGMLDIAMELGAVMKPSNGWYSRVNLETGDIEAKKWRAKDTDCLEFWSVVLQSEMFKKKVSDYYMMGQAMMVVTDQEIDEEVANIVNDSPIDGELDELVD
jgi:RecA/RadA recombinase